MKYGSYFEASKSGLPKEVYELEQEDMYTSEDVFYLADSDEERFNPYAFLYHGIRFDDNMKKFENILKEKKILAGKYIKGYYNYSDNANKGEYVSLTGYNTERISGFDVFIKTNISFLVSIHCNAFLTKCVDFNTWEKIKDENLRNLYSYMESEFWVKDFVPFEYIKAIGVPYKYLVLKNGKEYADEVLSKIDKLMKEHEVNLDVVDTNSYNKILISKKNIQLKHKY